MVKTLTSTIIFSLILFVIFLIIKETQSQRIDKNETSNFQNLNSQRDEKHLQPNNNRTPAPKNKPKKFVTHTPDHDALLEQAKELEKNKYKYRFATAIPVHLTPNNAGEWLSEDDKDIWKLGIHSPGASSLNLGFKNYKMPDGGELSIHQPEVQSPYRSFTASDNEEHGELWTPLLHGDDMVVTVTLPKGTRDQLALSINSINHGFRPIISQEFLKQTTAKIGGTVSGLCNIDAVCRSGDPNVNETLGPILDLFQNQIRSVAAYTLNGTDTCSGALINNTTNDKTPYFLTAYHCGINSVNDASAVFFFNFQNSFCRARNSANSASVGDGDLSQFSSGSIFRAGLETSDFCLVELDDPIPAHFDVYFAGWNRNNIAPSMAIGIHHPAVAEKRISVDTDNLFQDGNFWEVRDWDFGTTEPGSSGSPLFDSNGHIVGQLFGGSAACGNDLEDFYGKVSTSWTGGGSNSTRLRNWLAPISNSTTILDGISNAPAISIQSTEITEGNSGTGNMAFTLQLSEISSSDVSVSYQTSNQSATAGSDYTSTSGTIIFPPGITSQTISIPLIGDTIAESDETFLITLDSPSGAIIRSSQAIGTILTDDFSTPLLSGPSSVNAARNSTFNYQPNISILPATFSLIGNYPPGMTIDPNTGMVTWIPSVTGSIDFTIKASNVADSDTHTVSVNVSNGSNILSASELDDLGVEFAMEGTPWFRQTSIAQVDSDALRSGNIGNNELSSFSIVVNGPGTVSFWLRVDTEQGFDHLYFSRNGTNLLTRSGSINWQQYTYDLEPGLNTLAWIYIKDFTVSSGSDAVWLDGVQFSGYAGWTASHSMARTAEFETDSENDGAANGLEYATGLSPLQQDIHLAPQPTLGPNSLLQLTFSKPPGITDIIYDAQVSDDLVNWNTTGRSIITNNTGTFDARQNSTPNVDRQFMRLQVRPAP